MEPDRTANLTKIEQTSDQNPPFFEKLTLKPIESWMHRELHFQVHPSPTR